MKNNMLAAVFFLTAFLLGSFLTSKGILAETGCVPVYGGGVSCPRPPQVIIDKAVRNPATGRFVDNLSISDPKYRPQWVVTFRITVKNSGDQTLSKVTVTDRLPEFVDFMSGPGTYDAKTRTLTFEVKNLTGGSSQWFEVKARVVHQDVLTVNKNIVCPVNAVDAVSDSQKDHDESQFCIEKQLEVPKVPSAGPEHWLISLVVISTALVSGLYLRKKSYF